jgi:hypothetical protein
MPSAAEGGGHLRSESLHIWQRAVCKTSRAQRKEGVWGRQPPTCEALRCPRYRESSILAKIKVWSPRSSPGSFCMKTTKWWSIVTSVFECGLPVSKYFQDPCSRSTWSLLTWRYHDVIMAVGGEDDRKTCFWDQKMNLCNVTMNYGSLVVFIRQD